MTVSIARDEAPAGPAAASGTSIRLRRFAVAAAGPALIAVSVLAAMRGFVFWNHLTNRHPDILAFWLPRYCFLGRSLAAGHVPLWSPYETIGAPFAADPQSGWLYLPAMGLFSAFGCATAMRLFIVLQPLMAGLGLYWFLRMERLHRAAATVGGLSLAMMIAGSSLGISLPFAGTMAWTPFVLVGASGFLSARRTSRRLLWLAMSALAWGQVANAHMSHGLGMSTLLVGLYLVARSWRMARDGELRAAHAALLVAGFLLFLPLANLAILVPRLSLLSRSTLNDGYAALASAGGGLAAETLSDRGVYAAWPVAFAAAPGAYAGAAVLLSVPLAFLSRSRRHLAAAFGIAALVAWMLTLDLLIGAGWFRDLVLRLPFGDAYLHNPGRLRILVVMTLPVLGALGVQAWLETPPGRPLRWIGAAAAFWVLFPLAMGAHVARYALPAAGIVATAFVLVKAARGRRWAAVAMPAVLAVELVANALVASAYNGGTVYLGLEDHVPWYQQEGNLNPQPLRWPDVAVDDYLRPGPIVRYIRAHPGRILPWIPPDAYIAKGYLFDQQPLDWPALTNNRGMLFGIRSVLGYNPVQLPRYWRYIRAANDLPIFYNASVIQLPTDSNVRVLGARYLIVPQGVPSPLPGTVVAHEPGYDLVDLNAAQPVASLAKAGTADYAESNPEDAVVAADADVPSLVVVRNAWDEGWAATVDGRPAPVMHADYLLQAVPVPAGRHEVRMTYRDPSIGRGILASALVWTVLAGAFVVALLRERRRPEPSPAETSGRARPRPGAAAPPR